MQVEPQQPHSVVFTFNIIRGCIFTSGGLESHRWRLVFSIILRSREQNARWASQTTPKTTADALVALRDESIGTLIDCAIRIRLRHWSAPVASMVAPKLGREQILLSLVNVLGSKLQPWCVVDTGIFFRQCTHAASGWALHELRQRCYRLPRPSPDA